MGSPFEIIMTSLSEIHVLFFFSLLLKKCHYSSLMSYCNYIHGTKHALRFLAPVLNCPIQFSKAMFTCFREEVSYIGKFGYTVSISLRSSVSSFVQSEFRDLFFFVSSSLNDVWAGEVPVYLFILFFVFCVCICKFFFSFTGLNLHIRGSMCI